MAKRTRYLTQRSGAGGIPRFFWQPSTELQREHSWKPVRLAQEAVAAIMRTAFASGDEGRIAAALQQARAAAAREADEWNAKLDAWREQQALAGEGASTPGTVASIVRDYRKHRSYAELGDKTRREYDRYLAIIEQWAGDLPAAAIDARDADQLYATHADHAPATAHHLVRVGRVLWNFGMRYNKLSANPFAKMGIKAQRQNEPELWTPPDVAAFVATADRMGWHSVGTAVLLNSWIGQRQGDVIAMARSSYFNGALWITQHKTGAKVALPIDEIPTLRQRLAEQTARQDEALRARRAAEPDREIPEPVALLVCESTGRGWKADHFRATFATIRAEAADTVRPELAGKQFLWLRHSAVTALFDAGVHDVGAVTGHSDLSIHQIIARYRVRTEQQARVAFTARLEAERAQEAKSLSEPATVVKL